MCLAANPSMLPEFLPQLRPFEQRPFFDALIAYVIQDFLGKTMEAKEDPLLELTSEMAGVADLLHRLIQASEVLKEQLLLMVINPPTLGFDLPLVLRRCALAALAQDQGMGGPYEACSIDCFRKH